MPATILDTNKIAEGIKAEIVHQIRLLPFPSRGRHLMVALERRQRA